MSHRPSPDRTEREARNRIGLAIAAAAAVRFAFALLFPTIHGGDAAARLAHADRMVLGYQLPLPQALVVAGRLLSPDPIFVRLLFCGFGALLVGGLAALVGRMAGLRAGSFAAVILATDPLLVHYSIVPYQESVAYGLAAWAFYLVLSGRPAPGAVLMAGACLSRYEAWLLLPVFARLSPSRRWSVVVGAPVIAWCLWWRGLAPEGLYVLDLDPWSSRLSRVTFLAHKFLEYESLSVTALALAGFLVAVVRREQAILGSVGALGLITLVIVSFGHEFPPGSGRMSERLIHLPVLLAAVLAARALDRLSALSRPVLWTCAVALLLLNARNVRFERELLLAAAREPDLALAREMARQIERVRAPGQCVTVLAPPVGAALLDAYVAKVGAGFGNVERARERAVALAGMSPDRDRIAAQLTAPLGTVRAGTGCPLLVLVDVPLSGIGGGEPPEGTLVAEVTAGSRRAVLLRTRR